MNNITEKNAKTYTAKPPFVPEEDLMSEQEIKVFLEDLFAETSYEHYVLDGFIFLFNSVLEMSNQNRLGLQDLCANLNDWIYKETTHCDRVSDNYSKTIHSRYRKTDYTEKEKEVYKLITEEVGNSGKYGETEKADDEKEPQTEDTARPTIEERRKADRKAVAQWLYDVARKDVSSEPIRDLVGRLLTEMEMDSQALDTPEHIENVLAQYDELISQNPDDEKVISVSDKLSSLARNPKATDKETAAQIVNVIDGWLNPEGGEFDLAALLSAVLRHSDLPPRVYEVLSAELCQVPREFSDSAAFIRANLEEFPKKSEGE